jgi:hypothetical protein
MPQQEKMPLNIYHLTFLITRTASVYEHTIFFNFLSLVFKIFI